MNWIERMYEIKGKDLYSQNGEGLLLEYVLNSIGDRFTEKSYLKIGDLGSGDGFYLSNSKHLENLGCQVYYAEKENGFFVTKDNLHEVFWDTNKLDILSIDIDGNDYWVIDSFLNDHYVNIIISEFNPAFTDSRTIKYNPYHEWAGDDYYGFSFEAGKKLAEKHGYEIIFNVANMNLIMVRKDLITVPVPPVTYEQVKFFKESNRTDWVWI